MKQIILVHGDKGGVGKTQCATRTAAAFEAVGLPLTLVDGDVKNPGLHMLYEDRTTVLDIRTPAGLDALYDIWVESPHDVLVDMPAGGSDATAKMASGGNAEGMIELYGLLEAIDAKAVLLFVIDQSREVLAALRDELEALSAHRPDWIVVRNHYQERPFTLFEESQSKQTLLNIGGEVLDMGRLDPSLVEFLGKNDCNLNTIQTRDDAKFLHKLRAKGALREWITALTSVGLLQGSADDE
ncbi:hypothetical protein SAMN05421764_12111 [Donghicola eburneus]|nr:hypothetical protein [Donghicola eburneus]SFQ77947.1 hypothetical protein SAMN05421764_12111 [Donghicola eburneus]